VLRAADVLADHVDFWEEEAFRVNGKYRERLLTDFIRSGDSADREKQTQFKQLLTEYVELSTKKKGDATRQKALNVAVVEIKKWLRS
jgi:hypothetical protein